MINIAECPCQQQVALKIPFRCSRLYLVHASNVFTSMMHRIAFKRKRPSLICALASKWTGSGTYAALDVLPWQVHDQGLYQTHQALTTTVPLVGVYKSRRKRTRNSLFILVVKACSFYCSKKKSSLTGTPFDITDKRQRDNRCALFPNRPIKRRVPINGFFKPPSPLWGLIDRNQPMAENERLARYTFHRPSGYLICS